MPTGGRTVIRHTVRGQGDRPTATGEGLAVTRLVLLSLLTLLSACGAASTSPGSASSAARSDSVGAVRPALSTPTLDPSIAALPEDAGQLTLTGVLSGRYTAKNDAFTVCLPTLIELHLVDGAKHFGDLVAYLDGRVKLVVGSDPVNYYGFGGRFHPGKGVDVSSDLSTPAGRVLHAEGSFVCSTGAA